MNLSAASDDHEGRESRFVTGDSFIWGSPGRRVRRGVQKVKYVEYLGRRPFFVVRPIRIRGHVLPSLLSCWL